MKPRIKIDSSILSFIIILTGICFSSEKLYAATPAFDNFMDFLGFIFVIKGTFLRMIARGHKKAHSKESNSLVTSGIYQLVRNPMYLGSFTLGAGYVLMLWPWWALPIFVVIFLLRFRVQVKKEEKFLSETFGEEYTKYCATTPRVFPRIEQVFKIKLQDLFNLEAVFSTKEKRGLLTWPLLAIVLESFQQLIVYKNIAIMQTVHILLLSISAIAIGIISRLLIDYRNNE